MGLAEMNPKIIEIVKKHIKGHTRSCSYDNAIGDEGDFCSCNLSERKQNLYDDIEKLLKESK